MLYYSIKFPALVLGDHSYCKKTSKIASHIAPTIAALQRIVKRQRETIHQLRKRQNVATMVKNGDQFIGKIVERLPKSKQNIARFFSSQINLSARSKFDCR